MFRQRWLHSSGTAPVTSTNRESSLRLRAAERPRWRDDDVHVERDAKLSILVERKQTMSFMELAQTVGDILTRPKPDDLTKEKTARRGSRLTRTKPLQTLAPFVRATG